ncbi:DegT/DnrJ/EryC1/StrS family aminotransferase [Nocardioides sp. P5_E3]
MIMQVPYLDLRRQHAERLASFADACASVVRSGWYVLGDEAASFEREWADYCGSSHCVGVANGLDGLELSLRALALPPGGEVIVPSNTYIATWLAVSNMGLVVRPVEPDPETFNLSGPGVQEAMNHDTVAIMGVHLFGQLADTGIEAVARKARVPLVLDSAQAHGARAGSEVTSGTLGTMSVFSHYPTKNLGAMGDAGTVMTDNPDLARTISVLRNYGSERKYHNEVRGRNSRLDEIQAAILRVGLRFLDDDNGRRREIAARYHDGLRGASGITTPTAPSDIHAHVWHVYNVTCSSAEERVRISTRLSELGVGTQLFYPVPPHMSRAYADLGWEAGDFPIAKKLAETSIALPIAPYLNDSEVDYVISAVRSCVD